MALRIERHGNAKQYLNDHSSLNNTDLENQHPIKAITGLEAALGDKDDRLKEIEDKFKNGEVGTCHGEHTTHISFESDLEYEGNKLVKETFRGTVNKEVFYTYDENNNIIKKVVKYEDVIKTAIYDYDEDQNLIRIEDDGTEEVYLASGSPTSDGGSTGGSGGSSGSTGGSQIQLSKEYKEKIKQLEIQNIITHIKYDKVLNIPSNFSGRYFIDANLDHIEK